MNLSFFIAKRIVDSRSPSFSRFIIRLATAATALSVAVMIIAVAIVLGFKETIKDKMFVFWGHIHVSPFNANPASIISAEPIEFNDLLVNAMKQTPGVTSVFPYAVKPAIIKADSVMEGIKIKGITQDYPLSSNNAISFSGHPIAFDDADYARQLIVSKSTLMRINKRLGDTVLVYFMDEGQEFPRVRKLQIVGTFHTGMDEIDKTFALGDIRLIQRINNWDETSINGYQITTNQYEESDAIANEIYQKYLEPPLSKNTMDDIYPNIFSWLDLMNRNTYIILGIMAIVAAINLSTALLIFVLERTSMTGILKTLGMPMRNIRKVFLYHFAAVAIKGIILGTLFGVGFCLIQDYTHLIRLDESAYYMQYAPIKLVAWHVVAIAFGTLVFCMLVLLIPLLILRRISIIQAIRFK